MTQNAPVERAASGSGTLSSLNLPLHTDEMGVIRVGNTRVTLETVVHAFQNGETPEQIVDSFDVLKLSDVYAVITYYLQHQSEAEDYLRRAEKEAASIRREIESRNADLIGIRERLLARMEAQKSHS